MSGVTPEQLRRLADLLEQNPTLPRPSDVDRAVSGRTDDEANAELDAIIATLDAAGVEYRDERNDHSRSVRVPGLTRWLHVWQRHMDDYDAALSYNGSVQP